ncbi:MAG: hypothetical protein KJ949_01925, partial [Nanoarchaeota archaeon]|nr:hypothetical protein [Nanoarchaeota archaeon]
MDKKSVKIIFCVSLALILSLSLVSAGWFDWVGKITGRPVGECVDSDGGKNYFVKGSCLGEGSGTDSCISTTMLKEYFCMPQDFICIEDYYDCGTGYKCSGDKCVSSLAVDTDVGGGRYLKGT